MIGFQESKFRFVVWGAGNRGTDVINALRGRVEAIVDVDEALWGTLKREIPIISFEKYLEEYSDYIVIITPEGHEDSIASLLESHGVFHYFLYSEGFLEVETFMLQVDKSKLFNGYSKDDSHQVYGLSLLGICMYSSLMEHGYKCKYYFVDDVSLERKSAIGTLLGIEQSEIDLESFLHLSIPVIESDRCRLKNVKYDTYYNLIEKDIFFNPKIQQFRNVLKGKRCFIIGTGPSLRIEDLETLKNNQEICISMNGIYKSFDKTEWRPDYYMVGDLDAVYFGKQRIQEMNVKHIFVSDLAWCLEEKPNMYVWHIDRRWEKNRRPLFSEDFSKGSYAGLTITYDGALQLAAYMGADEIYLLGIDCNNYRGSKTSHFFDKYGEENVQETGFLNIDANIIAFEAAEDFSRAHNFRIYNATRGGKLEVFERKSFDTLF